MSIGISFSVINIHQRINDEMEEKIQEFVGKNGKISKMMILMMKKKTLCMKIEKKINQI